MEITSDQTVTEIVRKAFDEKFKVYLSELETVHSKEEQTVEIRANTKSNLVDNKIKQLESKLLSLEEKINRTCLMCGGYIQHRASYREGYCSIDCRRKSLLNRCKCGKTYSINTISHKNGYCSTKCFRKYDLELYKSLSLKEPRKLIAFGKFGMCYEPTRESELAFLFSKMHELLGFDKIKEVRIEFPDCIAIRNEKEVRIEFEYNSISFKVHGHDVNNCDVIVCWVHDWTNCKIEVISIKDFLTSNLD